MEWRKNKLVQLVSAVEKMKVMWPIIVNEISLSCVEHSLAEKEHMSLTAVRRFLGNKMFFASYRNK